MHRKRCKAAVSLSLISLILPCSAIWPFPPKRFSGNSLVDAGSLGLTAERAIAFGDFNGDQFLDVLMLEEDRRTLSIFLWNHENFRFDKSGSIRHSNEVYNVVPGDFTHSGKLDLLVMSRSPSANGELALSLYPALPGNGFDVDGAISLPSSSQSQPIPIDLDGDMKIDLLGMTPTSEAEPRNRFQVWQNVWNASESRSPLFKVMDPPFHGNQCKLANPHSNAVVDLNGDCLADVFLVCDDGHGGKYFQIWINNKADGFTLALEQPLPIGTQQISLADMDRDGTIDLVFPTCRSVTTSVGVGQDCYINIAYNHQLPLCTAEALVQKGAKLCRSPENLCIADNSFKFDLSETSDSFVRIPLGSIIQTTPEPGLLVADAMTNPPIPLALKLGDANLDGFPDILLISATLKGNIPRLIYSVPCGKDVAGCNPDGSGRRGFKVAIKGVHSLDSITDARSVSFIDMDEDGTLDIMVQRAGETMENGNIMFVQNNFYWDAFFLKAIVLNGACDNGWCYTDNGQKYHPFGVSYSGASYKYTVLDTSGRRSAAQVAQLPQTAYHSLQSPYSFFGLGRTNNYIENLFVGTTIHSPEHFINMEGVIPNSKLVVSPREGGQGGDWKKELFLRPGEWITWVTLTVIIGTVVLAIIVFVLHLNEKREDELERRRASHRINFDAL
ncbi:t-cell immunomodulatory protein [Moniliophthora roreri MCA 2997]|uniref:T-cell immunomodulatory protein n=1 Tax=Moniliophthora roreri (strain MCA 2997) TaxID=1381753 RepID=V2WZG9_MONRO|nr:t-cell immunomodulatory protein [Moniliophthora roreri MCA 2997]